MYYNILAIGIYLLLLSFTSNSSKPKISNNGIVQMKTIFYDSSGAPSFTDVKQVWYKDSSTIEKINRADFQTDSSDKTTLSFSTLFFRFIDLRQKVLYDYKHFSDSAKPINIAQLPDSMMKYGWSYYSHKVRRIQRTPQELSDTLIGDLVYKRIRFNFVGDDSTKGYKIAYYRCDEKARMFSLEKEYSKKINCTMIRFEDFQLGFAGQFATVEIEFLSDSLNNEQLKIFDVWQKNITKYPVVNKN